MYKRLWAPALSLVAIAGLTACGDETTNITNTSPETVATFKDLDKCTSDNSGDMAFVKDQAAMYFCADNEWKKMSASASNGSDSKDGSDGKNGTDGKDGKDGKDGASCTIKAIDNGYKVLCGGDSVGVLLNGSKGDSGVAGAAGKSAYELSGTDKTLDQWLASLKGENGAPCSSKEVENGVEVSCPGSDPVVIKNGTDGKSAYELAETDKTLDQWLASLKGKNGESCTSKEVQNGVEVSCPGSDPVVIKNGTNGKSAYELSGFEGTSAEWLASLNGKSCTSKEVEDGVQIDCPNSEPLVIKNGKDGSNANAFYDEWMIDPRDKQMYRIVKIGSLIWMADNLNYSDSVRTPNLKEASWCYNNDEDYCRAYGRLYGWTGAMNKDMDKCSDVNTPCYEDDPNPEYTEQIEQGICPDGWRIPNFGDWSNLLNATKDSGSTSAKVGKLKAKELWKTTVGTDDFGFTLLPAGHKEGSSFDGLSEHAYFWLAGERRNARGSYFGYWVRVDDINDQWTTQYNNVTKFDDAEYVRCVKDAPSKN